MAKGVIGATQANLLSIVDDSRTLSREVSERVEESDVQEKLVPGALELLESASAAVQRVAALADEDDSMEGCPKAVLPRQLSELADLCFLVQAELRALGSSLEKRRPKAGAWALLAAVERSAEEVCRVVCAVERDLCQLTGLPSLTQHLDFVAEALVARQVTAKFRHAVSARLHAPTETFLRSAGTSLARMIGRDEFSTVRVSDRIAARRLRARLIDHHREPSPTLADGLHLAEEVRDFAVLLSGINQRVELLRHDLKIVQECIETLATLDTHAALPSAEAVRLHQLYGRDEVLDRMLGYGADVSVVLTRLLLLYRQLAARCDLEGLAGQPSRADGARIAARA